MVLDRFLTLIPNLKSVFVFLRNMKIPIPIKTDRYIPTLLYVVNLTLVLKPQVVQYTS